MATPFGSQTLAHRGLVAGMYDQGRIGEALDRVIALDWG
jgi:hypothetical protein